MSKPGQSPPLKPARAATSMAAAGIFALGLFACSHDKTNAGDSMTASSTTASVLASAPIPTAINDVGKYGEDLYDQAKAEKWVAAKAYLDSLHFAATNLPRTDQIKPQRQQLDSAIAMLDQVVAAHHGATALEAANRVTLLSARMTTSYHGTTPSGVLLLDYYGRELDIWSAQKDTVKLRETATALASTWESLRPAVEKSGRTAAVRRTDALVARVKEAKTPGQFARIATPFLEEVDSLEILFTKQ